MRHAENSPQKPGFGKPGSIDPRRLFALPPAMQAEGVRLLFEMGLTMDQVRARLSLPASAIEQMLRCSQPFPRGGDVNIVAEGV